LICLRCYEFHNLTVISILSLIKIVILFSSGPLYLDDLEAILDEGLVSLNTEAEDGSVEEVCIP
jgi:hypothetical protein